MNYRAETTLPIALPEAETRILAALAEAGTVRQRAADSAEGTVSVGPWRVEVALSWHYDPDGTRIVLQTQGGDPLGIARFRAATRLGEALNREPVPVLQVIAHADGRLEMQWQGRTTTLRGASLIIQTDEGEEIHLGLGEMAGGVLAPAGDAQRERSEPRQ